MRRALVSMLMYNANGFQLHEKVKSKRDSLRILDIAMGVQLNPAQEMDPIESHLKPLSVKNQIIRLLDNDADDVWNRLLMRTSSMKLLQFRSATADRRRASKEAKVQTILAAVHGRWEVCHFVKFTRCSTLVGSK